MKDETVVHGRYSINAKQGSVLRELRLTLKEMENLISERLIRIFGDILVEFCRNNIISDYNDVLLGRFDSKGTSHDAEFNKVRT